MKAILSKEEVAEAFRLGVKDAILEMCEASDIIRTDQFMYQIQKGMDAAIWRIATNDTHTPCDEFYKAIAKGVKEAHLELI